MGDKNLTNEISAAKTFLDGKIQKEKKSLTIRLVVGILVTIFVFGYMFWLFRTLTELATPQGVRTVIVETIRNQGSQFLTMTTREIKGNKTQIVKMLTEQGLEKLVDILLLEGKKKLHGMITEISDETVDELNKHFEGVLRDKKDELAVLMADPTKEGALEEVIVKAFEKELRESVGAMTLDTTFNEPIGKKLSEANKQLHSINNQLKALIEKETLTHRETLMVRFIKLWVAYVDDLGQDEIEEVEPPGSSRL